jgi:hypothetical protein
VFLGTFDFIFEFKRSKCHGNADGMSRLPVSDDNGFTMDEVDVLEIYQVETLPLTFRDLSKAVEEDKSVSILIEGIKKGNFV